MNTDAVTGLWNHGTRVCDAELASSRAARRAGLLGREGVDGVLVIRPCRSVHSFRMRFAIDVAGCTAEPDGAFRVRWIRLLQKNRVLLPRLPANTMIEAESGSFERWGVKPGDRVEFR